MRGLRVLGLQTGGGGKDGLGFFRFSPNRGTGFFEFLRCAGLGAATEMKRKSFEFLLGNLSGISSDPPPGGECMCVGLSSSSYLYEGYGNVFF